MFGGGSGYGSFNTNRMGPTPHPRGMFNNSAYNWPKSYAPPPPPPAIVTCGELRRMDVGKVVEISGRLHKVSNERFMQIKDGYGVTQLVVPPERTDLVNRFAHMPLHSHVTVLGEVQARPERTFNEKMATGEIEVFIEEILTVKVNKLESKTIKMVPGMKRDSDSPPSITSEEYHKFHGLIPQLSKRKYTCADLANKLNETVDLLCWVEKTSKKFVTLVDGYSKIQCVVPNRDDVIVVAEHLTRNAVVNVTGKIKSRPKSQINYTTVNGQIELHVDTMEWPMFDLKNIATNAEPEINRENYSTLGLLTARTHACGQLRGEHAGCSVVLCGWLKQYKLDKFVMLVDSHGTVQCVISQQGCVVDLSDVPIGSVLKIEGTVAMRPPGMINEELSTGEIEVIIKQLVVLSKASNVPFMPLTSDKLEEKTRLRHRYMDLRNPGIQNNLRLRSKMLQNMRSYLMDKYEFLEVETPTLAPYIKGASSLKVQTDLNTIDYYLMHDPHLYFLNMMVGQMDRCFHISKSYLSPPVEGQTETTVLTIALSFTDLENFVYLIEQLLHHTFPKCIATPPFAKLSHSDAFSTYGSHQPDLSYDLKFYNVAVAVPNSKGLDDFGAFAVIFPLEVGKFSANMRMVIESLKRRFDRVEITCHLNSPLVHSTVEKAVRDLIKLDTSTGFVLACGDKKQACISLGKVRSQLALELSEKQLLHKGEGVKPAWVTEPPMFNNRHPGPFSFAAVLPQDADRAINDIFKVRAIGFSLVMNGSIYAQGCVRNTNPLIAKKQLEVAQFEGALSSNFMQAVESGCPPYATVSLDIDKLAALACSTDSIREVIAFPKSDNGQDMMFVDKHDTDSKDESEPSAKMPRLMKI